MKEHQDIVFDFEDFLYSYLLHIMDKLLIFLFVSMLSLHARSLLYMGGHDSQVFPIVFMFQ